MYVNLEKLETKFGINFINDFVNKYHQCLSRLAKSAIIDYSPCKSWFNQVMAGVELLAMSCPQCQKIMFIHPTTEEIPEVYKGEWVSRMCHGPDNTIFVQGIKNQVLQLELDPSTKSFTKLKIIQSGIRSRYSQRVYATSVPSLDSQGSYLFRVKSRSHGRDYRILDLDLVESIPSSLFIILFEQ